MSKEFTKEAEKINSMLKEAWGKMQEAKVANGYYCFSFAALELLDKLQTEITEAKNLLRDYDEFLEISQDQPKGYYE